MSRSWPTLHHDIDEIADEWRSNRAERQARGSQRYEAETTPETCYLQFISGILVQ